ncbi:glycosyltransferase family A protein [Achromobacter sp. F4_2707]|uniref:glycosyltransferase n=1 Tax=Achromobacter sp. F4_2707 TaxID=3114286 RepID=UPI0039C70941
MSCISVLLPTYKPGNYLKRCLESIEAQTLSKDRFKVYIALNGPSEVYQEFVVALLEQCTFRCEYVYLEEAGVSRARNFLLESSHENYVAFVDDDDVLSSDYLKILLSCAEDGFISVSDSKDFKCSVADATRNFVGNNFVRLKEKEESLFFSRKYFSSPWAKLIPRDLIGNVRFNERLKVGEDSLFMAEISKRVKGVKKADEAACYYVCVRDGSASRKKALLLEELRRIAYLVCVYTRMLLQGYNVPFVLSRIAATLMHLRRIF